MNNQDVDFYVPKQKYFYETIKPLNIQTEQPNHLQIKKAIVISGFPYDEGTKRNGGRVGGAIGSTIFRKNLSSQLYISSKVDIYDSGDIQPQKQLQDAHILLYQKHLRIFNQFPEAVVFSIGGSNDQSYPNARSLLQKYPQSKIGVINIDAHFDVRPLKQGKAHSGSPFRQMLQNQLFKKNESIFVQFANKGATCSNEHYKYLKQKGVKVYWLEKDIRMYDTNQQSKYRSQAGQLFQKIINYMKQKVQYIFVSFDTDSINSKYMPGVSAPSVVGGLTSSQAIQIMEISGKQPKVKLLDFSEFNPAVQSLISSKMLTQMFYTFAKNFHQRK